MNLEEFNPAPPEIAVNDKTAYFNKFRLIDKAWAVNAFASKEQPNGLINLTEGLSKLDAVVVARFAWRLVSNKREIGEDNFYAFAENKHNLMIVLEAINKILDQSQPTSKANERLKELKKSSAAKVRS